MQRIPKRNQRFAGIVCEETSPSNAFNRPGASIKGNVIQHRLVRKVKANHYGDRYPAGRGYVDEVRLSSTEVV